MIRWLSMLVGVVGTYRKNETVDVEYRSGGQVEAGVGPRGPRVIRE